LVYIINYSIFTTYLKFTLIYLIMENNEIIMSNEESLRIITGMINKTRVNIRESSFHLLFWGWLLTICSLSEFLLGRLTSFRNPYEVWFCVIPGILVSLGYGFIRGRKAKVHTYASRIYIWTWIGFLVTGIILFVIKSPDLRHVAPLTLMLSGLPTFISGVIIRFRPLVLGGISFWIFSLIANFASPDIAAVCVPVAMVTGYLVPGYILRYRVDNDSL
jgi:hypothetical protein